MKFELKIKKSGGVYVTPTVHRIIRHGNHARDAGKWTEAIREYRQALQLDPSLYHIWIQYGHVAHWFFRIFRDGYLVLWFWNWKILKVAHFHGYSPVS
ncbi:tetratricopeptide repeat protein, partial [Gluconacetobacter entanii]|uniref:tetratricopeptide repeat protein n=1 Tax=Gluconacetobacter entanii TaxID=108528 RepID=UPI0011B5B232